MSGIKNLVSVTDDGETGAAPSVQQTAPESSAYETSAAEETWVDDTAEDADDDMSADKSWIVPALAVFLITAWSGLFAFAHSSLWRDPPAMETVPALVSQWAIPVILIVGLWLLIQRNSRSEANRFARAARALSTESQQLEQRLITVNRELSLAREFIAAQGRDLESLGRVASERLSDHANHLQSLIRDNSSQLETIRNVSKHAVDNMEQLRGNLPVLTNSARDVTNQIGNAGRTASEQLDTLNSGFDRLAQTGSQTEARVLALRDQVDDAVTEFTRRGEEFSALSAERFRVLGTESDAFRARLAEEEDKAVAALQDRLAVLSRDAAQVGEELRGSENAASAEWSQTIADLRAQLSAARDDLAELDQNQHEKAHQRLLTLKAELAELDASLAERIANFDAEFAQRRDSAAAREKAAMASLESDLRALDAKVAERHERQKTHVASMAEQSETLADKLETLNQRTEQIVALGGDSSRQLSEAISRLSDELVSSRLSLEGTEALVARLTDDAVRLLEIVRASVDHGKDDLPRAIGTAEERLQALQDRSEQTHKLFESAEKIGRTLDDQIAGIRKSTEDAVTQLDTLHERMTEKGDAQAVHIAALRESLSELSAEADTLSGRARDELEAALSSLQQATRQALTGLESAQSETIHQLAERVGEENSRAIENALRESVEGTVAELDESAREAAGRSREAAQYLYEQLARVSELTVNLERRVAQAKQNAEEKTDGDFARKMSQITESLNSHSIDIAKAMSQDVSDTAWAAYMKGDRGIFTRRAVKLLDREEAREIAQIYEDDDGLHEIINRYIHDFEAMLRSVLSTAEGNTMAVTLLSSDMGKLYVALAQAIERLRR
ncbi:ATPase [Altericroceibacterium endophyticum]|uniref:ATPase n=1 Tax=Altericroceibacterium endophyticum TaxID=1808508 RepID=A0A6I4T5N4_9SPHN|nr:ATPase [Altericroceibacterium endophyticum]MXO65988.1 ATPase [Altericroceibacterium endophyticum]